MKWDYFWNKYDNCFCFLNLVSKSIALTRPAHPPNPPPSYGTYYIPKHYLRMANYSFNDHFSCQFTTAIHYAVNIFRLRYSIRIVGTVPNLAMTNVVHLNRYMRNPEYISYVQRSSTFVS